MQINIAVGTNRFGLFTCNAVGKNNTCWIVGREISAGVSHHMRDLEVEPLGNIRDWKGMKRSTKKGMGRTALFDIHKVLDFTQLILNWKQVEAESQNFAIHNLEIQMICVIALKQHKG